MESTTKSSQEYISLFDAAKFCPYSEPYLRLRARQGKLKSIKIGKKWMTTKDWIQDYILQSKAWNEKIIANRAKKSAEAEKPGNFDFLAPRVIAQPAKTFSVPQIEFAAAAKLPAISIPKPAKPANYASPQLLFVLGSSALLALMLFALMAADFGPAKSGIQTGQASLASGVAQAPKGESKDSFEAQLDPQTLEKVLSRQQAGRTTAAVDQAQIIAPVVDNSLAETVKNSITKIFNGGK